MSERAPTAGRDRIVAIDVLRGFALLGILPVNIISFGLIGPAYLDPTTAGGFAGANRVVWWGTYLLFDQKMMAIFSMLFGAGLALQWRRAQQRDGRLAGVWYRRTGWLLLFGLLHAYLIWFGDILVAYALCGLVLFLFRKLGPKWLLTLGLLCVAMILLIYTLLGFGLDYLRSHDPADWQQTQAEFHGTPEANAEERRLYAEGGFGGQLRHRAGTALVLQTFGFVIYVGWRAIGLMFIGMALLAWGVLSGERSDRCYRWMCLLGYGLGLPLVAVGAARQVAAGFDMVGYFLTDAHFNTVGSLGVAAGHVGLVMRVVRSGRLAGLCERLACVGRTAFSGYIGQSLVCTGIFYSWGLGRFGALDRLQLAGVVAAIWVAQLLIAPLWLARFRFGPLEWLWRSLTYWRRQPMRRAA